MRPSPNKEIKNEKLLFLKRLLKNPKALGAVMPSSKVLGNLVAQHVDVNDETYVVEVGAGTGSLTRSLLASGIKPSRLVVIELDVELCDYLRTQFPDVCVIQGNAASLQDLLPSYTHGKIATIISGIPLINLSRDELMCLFKSFQSVIDKNGHIIQFTYGPLSPFPHKKFGLRGVRLGFVIRNVPPATVWSYSFVGNCVGSTLPTTSSKFKLLRLKSKIKN